MAQKNYISVQKTARYFLEGEINKSTQVIWIVLHGYGQNAEFFIRKFRSLVNEETLVIAPEGMNHYYTTGSKGRVGASWMTKEERLADIADYCNYLDAIVDQLNFADKQLHVIGFSQGAATASRWVTHSNYKFQSLSLWGSVFPPDLDYFTFLKKDKLPELRLVIGDKDEYYKQDVFTQHKEFLHHKNIVTEVILYQGNHNIFEVPLLQLRDSLTS